jgi:hydroxymethylpyrimidine kinase/phosphomethylpyrimidine kinase/thiamine-phosphate diphosphorylase
MVRDGGRPIVWSIAGTDSGGGAGIAADLRVAAAFGVHLCPVVAAVTAQNSRAVTRIDPVRPEVLEAQLDALEHDMRPQAIKTGLLGSREAVEVVARRVDALRSRGPVALIVDPVLASSTGTALADEAAVAALRALLLPRADLVTPNHREAQMLTGVDNGPAPAARALRAAGAAGVCVTGGDEGGALALDWVDTGHACGWLALPRVPTPHNHGTGCTFATGAAAAVALDFAQADALVLAKMATAAALRRAYPAGEGAGPVAAVARFAADPTLMPTLSFDATPPRWVAPQPAVEHAVGLYAIVDIAARASQVLAAGVRTVQLRIKQAETPLLRKQIEAAAAACRRFGARLFINDHWQLAIELGAEGVHLGQQDLAALGEAGRLEVAHSGLALGVSSRQGACTGLHRLRPGVADHDQVDAVADAGPGQSVVVVRPGRRARGRDRRHIDRGAGARRRLVRRALRRRGARPRRATRVHGAAAAGCRARRMLRHAGRSPCATSSDDRLAGSGSLKSMDRLRIPSRAS